MEVNKCVIQWACGRTVMLKDYGMYEWTNDVEYLYNDVEGNNTYESLAEALANAIKIDVEINGGSDGGLFLDVDFEEGHLMGFNVQKCNVYYHRTQRK